MQVQEEPLLDIEEEALLSKDNHNPKDEEEETLSLCDLPLYGDQSVDDELSQESQGSSFVSSSEHDHFEFFSQELNPNPPTTTMSPQPDNIIFCGKIISYKQPNIPRKDTLERKHQNNKNKIWGLFGWKTLSSSKRNVYPKRSSSHFRQSPNNKNTNNNKKSEKGYEFPVHKMSILTSSSSGKTRWYFLLFGLSRISTEVDLRDIKNRQSKRLYPSPTSSPLFRIENNGNDKISVGKTNGWWGLWGVIRALSCGGNHHPNTMVSESITSTWKS